MLYPYLTLQAIAETGRQIKLNSAAIETVLSHLPSDEEILRQYALLHQDPEAFFRENDAASDCCMHYLSLFTAFAHIARKPYAERGISELVWTDTMHDMNTAKTDILPETHQTKTCKKCGRTLPYYFDGRERACRHLSVSDEDTCLDVPDQKSALPTVRGCGRTSRMLSTPVRYMTRRSKPRPKPAWWQPP